MQLKPEMAELNLAKDWLASRKFSTKSDRRTRRVTDEELRAIEEEWILDPAQRAELSMLKWEEEEQG